MGASPALNRTHFDAMKPTGVSDSAQQPQQQHATVAQFYSQLVELAGPHQQHDESASQRQEHQQDVLHQQQQQHEQQQQQHGCNSTSRPPPAAAAGAAAASGLQVPFAPVRFSSRTHLLDPNTGAVTLPPKAAAEADSAAGSSRSQQQQQRRRQGAQPPMHPTAPANIARANRPLDRSNLGYKLLAKAGWQEGQGLGASEQGSVTPLTVSHNKGNSGLGFSKQQQPLLQQGAASAGAGAASSAQLGGSAAAAAAAVAGPVLGSKRVEALVAAELAAEDLETKVKRHKQLQEQKVKEQRDKAIQSYVFRAFNEVDGRDSNPLLAKSHRLTATNPLLD